MLSGMWGGKENQDQIERAAFGRARRDKRALFPRAALVGLCAGLLATLFRWLASLGDGLRLRVVEACHGHGAAGALLLMGFSTALVVVSVTVVKRWAPEAAGSGIPHLEAVLHGYRELRWRAVLVVKFFGGIVAMASGLVVGREGPTVQMGGAIGEAIAQATGADSVVDRNTLRAAGAGAGLAAAFNAPLAGLVFVLEELQRDFQPRVFGAAFVAAAIADAVARLLTGQQPAFKAPIFSTPALSLLPVFAVLGVAMGLFAVVFNKGIVAGLNGYSRWASRFHLAPIAATGCLIGLFAFLQPAFVGNGHDVVESSLASTVIATPILALLAGRFLLTLGSYATGAPGGVFAPLLALGALFGYGVGVGLQPIFPGVPIVPGAFAAIGMAALFSGIVRAPLTGIVLILEMTASFSLMLPLLVGSLCAYFVAEWIGDLPLYEALLQRDLRTGGHSPEGSYAEPFAVTVEVKPGAAFEGKRVRELGLPKGVLITGVVTHGRETLPDADLVLTEHMRLSVVISPDRSEALARLIEGCDAHGT